MKLKDKINSILNQEQFEIDTVKSSQIPLEKPSGFDRWIEGREHEIKKIKEKLSQ